MSHTYWRPRKLSCSKPTHLERVEMETTVKDRHTHTATGKRQENVPQVTACSKLPLYIGLNQNRNQVLYWLILWITIISFANKLNFKLFFVVLYTGVGCSDQSYALGGGAHLRSALHLHRVTSLWEVLVTEPGAFRTQVQPSASKVPLLEKGHLRAKIPHAKTEMKRCSSKHQHLDWIHVLYCRCYFLTRRTVF